MSNIPDKLIDLQYTCGELLSLYNYVDDDNQRKRIIEKIIIIATIDDIEILDQLSKNLVKTNAYGWEKEYYDKLSERIYAIISHYINTTRKREPLYLLYERIPWFEQTKKLKPDFAKRIVSLTPYKLHDLSSLLQNNLIKNEPEAMEDLCEKIDLLVQTELDKTNDPQEILNLYKHISCKELRKKCFEKLNKTLKKSKEDIG